MKKKAEVRLTFPSLFDTWRGHFFLFDKFCCGCTGGALDCSFKLTSHCLSRINPPPPPPNPSLSLLSLSKTVTVTPAVTDDGPLADALKGTLSTSCSATLRFIHCAAVRGLAGPALSCNHALGGPDACSRQTVSMGGSRQDGSDAGAGGGGVVSPRPSVPTP